MESTTIDSPHLWRLVLGIAPGALHAVAFSTVADATMIYRRLTLGGSDSLHRQLEEAIYAAPWLLSDFGRVDIAVSTPYFTVVPAGLDDDGLAASLTDIAGDTPDAVELLSDSTPQCRVVWALDADCRRFLARTFRNAPVHHAISPLLKYFDTVSSASNRAKLFVHLSDETPRRLDIIEYDASGCLRMAVSKEWEVDNDALYYILSVAELTGFDRENDELQLCGDQTLRSRLSTLLSRYVRHVLPLIFPSAALRSGREAFRAPFPLVILPLCE
ncbi:MAG: DUF3822 family protein [Muribaculaceae bacterium]|nr:DUF3822 family protein [Muribaculaceae bacterium]